MRSRGGVFVGPKVALRAVFGIAMCLLGTACSPTVHPSPSSSPSGLPPAGATSPSATASRAAMPATSCPPPGTAIAGAPGEGKTVALTFDDGVGPSSLAIAEVLKSRGVTATFFDTGRHDDADRADVRQLAVWGFAIEDHSWDHLYPQEVPGGWSLAYLRDQITRTADLQQQLTGRRPCYFRPPGGFRMNVAPVVNSLGMSLVPWSIDTEDWRQPATTTDAATQAIIERATAIGTQQHPIVLMHASKASHEPDSVVSPNRSNTVAALPAIIDWYQVHGFRFVAY